MSRTLDVEVRGRIDGKEVGFGSVLRGPDERREGAYVCKLRRGEVVEVEILRADGGEMDVQNVRFLITAPLLNYAKIITPDCGRFYVDRLRAIHVRSCAFEMSVASDGMPFIAFVGQSGAVEFSFGLASNLIETRFRSLSPRISARNALLGGDDDLILEAQKPTRLSYGRCRSVREDLFVGASAKTWFHALRDYSGILRQRLNIAHPSHPEAWEPSWCTWTAWPSDTMTEERILANGREAAKLGIKHIIIDDGWFGLGLDTDTGALNLGDYYPDPKKITDLPGLVRRLQELGLRVLLWYAPPCISPDSNSFAKLQKALVRDDNGPVKTPNGFHMLCPRHPEARARMAAEIRRMVREYGADGFKTDLYNCYPPCDCRAPHEHDCASAIEGLHRTMALIWQTLREENPRGLLELKQNYGNVITAQYGTMVRAGDTAYDVDTNLERCYHTLAYAPVVHNDYLAWSKHDTPQDLAAMLIKMLAAGVPTFSRDLPSLSDEHKRTLGVWLDFYKRHLDIFKGRREPQTSDLSVWQFGAGTRSIVVATRTGVEVKLEAEAESTTILNGSGATELALASERTCQFRASTSDHFGEPVSSGTLRIDGRARVPVPPGGMVVLEVQRRNS